MLVPMSNDFDRSKLSIIYAEDEFVFREITIPAIKRAGISKENLHVAEDGVEALEFLEKLQDSPNLPLLMLLDVRMPNMDGIQCAKKVQEMVAENSLRRIPFMVCCSAAIRQVSFEDELGVFQVTMPKPFSNKEVDLCIGKLAEWWSEAHGGEVQQEQQAPAAAQAPKAASAASPKAPASADAAGGTPNPGFDLKCLDMVVADDEPICRMAVVASLMQMGFQKEFVHEVEDDEEMMEEIQGIQARTPDGPILVFLGNETWLPGLCQQCTDDGKKRLYTVCTSVDSDRVQGGLSSFAPAQPKQASEENVCFNAFLPRQFKQADIKAVLDECSNWFHAA